MADIQSNINVNINTSEALANIRTLQRQISAFYESMARSGAAASAAASNMQSNLINTINQTGKFSASIKTITSTTESFTTALEKNKLSMGQYFKFAGGASKTFGKFFRTEMDTIDKVARERVKTLQTQYVRLGRDASGALKSIAIRPLALDMEDLGTKTAIAAQKQQLMNQLLKQGSTNLLNFGKNTQWAGRQLMVGFTIPLSMVGTAAAKTFMQMEEQAIKFKRVYGDSMTPTEETNAMVDQVRELASEFTKYGVAAQKTMELAATAAAAGNQGADLIAQVREANRLAVLGQVEQQDALNTTISVTNAFGVAASDLAKKIDFLNAVENQTVTSIEDLTIAVPKAGPVVQQLGGDVEDLAFFLTAMKEGGINASEGANALKSGLASLINPTGKASEMLAGFGINIKEIVEANRGDVKGLVIDFASALDTLDPLSRARAIEQLFGKFQFSRLSTLFQNVIADGTQASRVLELTGKSASELAALSSKELGTVAASSMFKFQKAVEDLKVALAPIGEIFLKLVTPVIEFGTKILDNFNKLDAGAKNFIMGLIAVVGGLGPVLIMTFGLLANGIANIIKGFMLVRRIFGQSADSSKYLGDQTEYMTQQQLEAASVAASLEQVHQRLEQRFTSEAVAVDKLTQALQRANNANLTFQGRGASAATMPKKYAKGVVSVPGPKGAGDIVPAMLAPGEAVVPAKQATKYAALIQGIVADNIPGFEFGNVDSSKTPRGAFSKNVQRFGYYGSEALAASHFEDLSPGNLSATLKRLVDELGDEFGNLTIDVLELSGVLEDGSRQFTKTTRKISDIAGMNVDMITTGQVFAGTTRIESKEKNAAYQAAGIGGAPLTLTQVTENAAKAQIALDSQTKASESFKLIWQELVQEGAEAQKLLQSSNRLEHEYAFTKKQILEGLRLAVAADPKNKDIQQFATIAQQKITKVDEEMAILVRNGMDEETALQKAKAKLTAELFSMAQSLATAERGANQPLRDTGTGRYGVSSQSGKRTTIREVDAKGIPVAGRAVKKNRAISNVGSALLTADTMAGISSEASVQALMNTKVTQIVTKITNGVEQGLNEAIQRNSPPKEAIKIGRDYGFALNGALRESIPKVKVAGEAFGVAATTSMTTINPAMSQHLRDHAGKIVRPYLDAQGKLVPIATQKIAILDKEAVAAKRAAEATALHTASMLGASTMGFIGPLQQSPLSDRPGKKGKQQKPDADENTGRLNKTANVIRNTSFALTSLAAAGTMAGGAVGQVSTAIMQFSGVSYALLTVMDLLTLASGKAKAGLLAQIGSFLMFSKGGAAKAAGGLGFFAALKNAILPLTGAFKAAGGGVKGFFNIIKLAIPALLGVVRTALSFVPVVGLVVTGLTLLGFGIKAVIDANERARKELYGVAEASKMTAEQVEAVGNVFQKEKFISSFSQIGSGMGATATQEQIQKVDLVLKDQEFLGKFEETIQTMKDATARDVQSIQDQIALQLVATGQYTEEEVNAVIKALQIKAERTEVSFDFKKINIADKNPKTFQNFIDRLTADANAAAQGTSKQDQATLVSRSSQLYQTILSITDAQKSGAITAKQYGDNMKYLSDTIGQMKNPTEVTNRMLKEFSDDLINSGDLRQKEIGNTIKGVKGLNGQILIMQLVAQNAIPNMAELGSVVKALNIIALDASGVKVLAADLAAAKLIAEQATGKLGTNAAEIEKLRDAITGNDGTPTGGTKSIFQQATEDLSNNIKAIKEASKAYSLLSKAGFSAADAFTLAQNPALATALATTKVGTDKWKQLVSLAKEFISVTKGKALSDTLANLSGEAVRLTKFEKLSKYLSQSGLSAEEISSILQDDALADSLIDATEKGKKGFQDIDKFINSKLKNIELRVKIFPEEFVKQGIQKAMDAFSAEENVLNIKFRINTKADQDLIRETQARINALNFQADDYEAGLTRLEDGEGAINEKYDNRLEALDKIIAANDRITDQNKEELNVFQMVARGDIAGAAAGIAQLQQQKAKNALEAKKESLQAQRTNELESLTAEVMVNGQKVRMTRNQIEENLKNIKEQIFKIEEDILEPAQRRIEKAQEELDKQVASQTILGKTKDEWELIGGNIDLAKTKTTSYIAELQRALNVAKDLQTTLEGGGSVVKPGDFPGSKTGAQGGKSKSGGPAGPGSSASQKDQTIPAKPTMAPARGYEWVYNQKTKRWGQEKVSVDALAEARARLERGSYSGPNQNELEVYQNDKRRVVRYESGLGFGIPPWEYNASKKNVERFENKHGLMDLTINKPYTSQESLERVSTGPQLRASGGMIVPKKFAAGGFARGTDTVPAMLTPGEFVVSKYGVENYGVDNLRAINNGTAKANSVYNGYNINVNVRSNSNPDQIANAVMTQIRQINAQQVRGSKF